MKKEELYALMPTVVIEEAEVEERIEQERKTIEAGESFISRLSINRYLYKPLITLEVEQSLELFNTLVEVDFVLVENELYWNQLDIESLAAILEEKFQIEDLYELDQVYLTHLVNGRDITEETIEIEGEEVSISALLRTFVFQTGGMSFGDTPNVMLMLVVKKALLGIHLAQLNVQSLLNKERTIYDISILH